jgi:hypothetical protein
MRLCDAVRPDDKNLTRADKSYWFHKHKACDHDYSYCPFCLYGAVQRLRRKSHYADY